MTVKTDDGHLHAIHNWIFLEWFFFICLIISLKGIPGKAGSWNFDNFFFVSWNANCKKIMKNTRSTVSSKRKHETDKWNVVLLLSPISWTNDADSFPLHVRFEVAVTSVCIWRFEIFGHTLVEGNRNLSEMFPKTPGKAQEVAIGWWVRELFKVCRTKDVDYFNACADNN